MNIEEQVLTIEQAKHLQELGLDMSDAAVVSYLTIGETGKKDRVITQLSSDFNESCYSSSDYIYRYTLQEMLDKLPIAFRPKPNDRNMLLYDSIADCQIWYENYYGTKMVYKGGDTLLDAAYKMLCWVLENGFSKEDTK